MFMRTDLLPSILVSELHCIQFPHVVHRVRTSFYILLGELQFFNRLLPDYIQSTRLQSVYMHPDYLQSTPLESTTQPTHKNLSSWRTCRFYRKKPEQHSAQTRTRILPEEVLMLQASNGTVRVLCI